MAVYLAYDECDESYGIKMMLRDVDCYIADHGLDR